MWSRLYEAIIISAQISGREFHFFIEVLHFLCFANTINFVGLYVVQCPQATGIHDLW
jgi:hypothetical protein